MSANLDVQNRNSVELIGKDASICPQSDGDTLKTISDMEVAERHCVSSEIGDQSLTPESDSSAAEPNDGVENSVDNNSNSNVPFVNIDNATAEVDSNDNEQGTVTEHDDKVTVEENGKTDCQDTTMVSPSDSGTFCINIQRISLEALTTFQRILCDLSTCDKAYLGSTLSSFKLKSNMYTCLFA